MLTKLLPTILSVALLSAAAIAQDDMYRATTERQQDELGLTILKNENLALSPQAGVLVYSDAAGNTSSRLAAGLTLDWNAAQTLAREEMRGWFLGPSTGIIYSHLGNHDANFFGTDSQISSNAGGANFFYVPLNIKVGYNIVDKFRMSIRGGANLTYRSVADAVMIGSDTTAKTTIFPNVGADMEWGLGMVALGLRPDVTLGTEKALFSGTMTVAIPLV